MTQHHKDPHTPENGTTKPHLPKLAIVLGSSGTRAFAALPFLQQLDQLGLRADLVIGCGGGGLIAALWSAGYDLSQILHIFTHHFSRDAYDTVSSDALNCMISEKACQPESSSCGLYNPVGLRKAYKIIFKDMQLQELTPQTLLYATDITTGEGVCLGHGSIATAVEASGAYYPVMPPVSHHGRLLANGAIVSPLPVMEAVKRDMDLILTVHLEETAPMDPANFLEGAMAMHRISSRALRRAQLFGAINVHDYEICMAEVHYPHPVLPWDVEHIPGILMQGKASAQNKIPELLRMREDFSRRHANDQFTYSKASKTDAVDSGSQET